ncbi:unnamed protein product [Closterium sp. NIES-53]
MPRCDSSTIRASVESSPPMTSHLTSLSVSTDYTRTRPTRGDLAADDTAATRCSPRLETPPDFPPRTSSPPPQPAALDSGAETAGANPGGAKIVGEGSGGAATGGASSGGAATGGAGSWGAATGGADSGGPASPSSGGGDGGATGAIGAGCTSAAGAGGAGAAGSAPCRLFFLPQPQSSLLPPNLLLRGSSLPAPAPHTKSRTERREPETRASTPVRARCVTRPRPPAVPGTHGMALCPSSIPQRVVLPQPPVSSLPHVPDPESDLARAASPTVTRLLATVITDPNFESTTAFALVTELVDFAVRSHLDYVASLVTESESLSPPSVGGEPALSNALDIPTPCSCAQAIAGEYSSKWQTAMDAEMASWKSTGTYVDEVPPPGMNIVNGMWIFRVKQPPGSPPAFKACYVARGFSQRQGVNFFQNFPPTPKMTTLRVLLHVAAQCGYELHSLDFSTVFLQGSLHEEIWLRLRIDTTLPSFYVLMYVDDLVFATADTEALALVKAELQERHTCTDLGELRSYLDLQITRDRARRTITLTDHSLSAPHSVESVEPSGPYPELVGCLIYLMTCTRPDLAYPLSLLARYVAPSRHRKVHWDAAKRVLRYLCSTSGMGLVLGGQGSVVLTRHSDTSWADNQATHRSSQGYTFSLGSGSVSWRSTRSSSVLGSSCEADIFFGTMAAQELRWPTDLLIDLRPRSPPVLYVDNKAMLALCHKQRLEHRTKHIALRYFLVCELQQRGQLRLSYVASRANTADVFTKALGSGDHQRFCTALRLVPTLPHLLAA